MMHDLLYAIACRRAHGNRVHSEDQAHLPDRLLMDSPGMVIDVFSKTTAWQMLCSLTSFPFCACASSWHLGIFDLQELSQVQGLSLINCKEPLQGTMLEKMQDLRIIILHNIAIKGFCSKALNQVQFLYWGKSHVSQEVRLPFQIGKLRKLEMMILRAHEIDLLMKVLIKHVSYIYKCPVNPAIFSLPFLELLQGFYDLWTLLKTGLVFWLVVSSTTEGSDHHRLQQHGGAARDSACSVNLTGASPHQLQQTPWPDSCIQ